MTLQTGGAYEICVRETENRDFDALMRLYLEAAEKFARERSAYKIMLMTGAKDAETLRFYRNAGFDGNEKTAFIKRLD